MALSLHQAQHSAGYKKKGGKKTPKKGTGKR